jgi:hypothetical protein
LAYLDIDNFAIISVNGGELSKPWDYVRKINPGSDRLAQGYRISPLTNVYNNNIRCAWGADENGKGVRTLQVNAGDTLTFYPVRPLENGKDHEQDGSSPVHLSAKEISKLIDRTGEISSDISPRGRASVSFKTRW